MRFSQTANKVSIIHTHREAESGEASEVPREAAEVSDTDGLEGNSAETKRS